MPLTLIFFCFLLGQFLLIHGVDPCLECITGVFNRRDSLTRYILNSHRRVQINPNCLWVQCKTIAKICWWRGHDKEVFQKSSIFVIVAQRTETVIYESFVTTVVSGVFSNITKRFEKSPRRSAIRFITFDPLNCWPSCRHHWQSYTFFQVDPNDFSVLYWYCCL